MTACQLYRHFAADGSLLYVGISLSAIGRLSQHNVSAPWFPLIARVEMQSFETRDEARTAERLAIQTERPKFNSAHMGRALGLKPRKAKWHTPRVREIAFSRWVTATEFVLNLGTLGFAQSDKANDIGLSAFARWLPCEARQARRMAAGDADIPPAVGKLLRLMLKHKIKPEDVK